MTPKDGNGSLSDLPEPHSRPASRETDLPEVLVVSWHWPPANRACTGVLANLFRCATSTRCRVITRRVPLEDDGDSIGVPPLETLRVGWDPAAGTEGTLGRWRADALTVRRLIRTAVRLHRARPVERVIAVYPHRFGLLAGCRVAERLKVPLVLYMHDLFAECYRSGSRMKHAFWTELDRRAFRRAALVVVPTEEFAAHYHERGARRVMVVPHCLPRSGRPGQEGTGSEHTKAGEVGGAAPRGACPLVPQNPWPRSAVPTNRARLKLIYTGNLYDAHRDAIRTLLAAVDATERVEVELLTRPHPMLGDRPVRWGSRTDCREAVGTADVCVVALGHDTPYPAEIRGCFPSKIVDYLAAARPILAVVPPGCFVDRFVRETGSGVVVNTLEGDDIRAAIESLRDAGFRARLGEAAARVGQRLRAEDHWRRLAAALARLDSVTQAPRVPRARSSNTERRLPLAGRAPETEIVCSTP